MNRFTQDELNLHPKSDAELHKALLGFEQKWHRKAAARLGQDDRFGRG